MIPRFEREPPDQRYIGGILHIRDFHGLIYPSETMRGKLVGVSGVSGYTSPPRYLIGEATYVCDCWYGEEHYLAIIHPHGYEIIHRVEQGKIPGHIKPMGVYW